MQVIQFLLPMRGDWYVQTGDTANMRATGIHSRGERHERPTCVVALVTAICLVLTLGGSMSAYGQKKVSGTIVSIDPSMVRGVHGKTVTPHFDGWGL